MNDTTVSAKVHSEKQRKRRKRKRDEFERIEGIIKIPLSAQGQKNIGCIGGENVTGEDPWTFVTKETLIDELFLHEHESELWPIKDKIERFPKKMVLIGYLPEDTRRRTDEFYFCLNLKTEEAVLKIIERLRKERQQFLDRAVMRKVGQWKSLNSEEEIYTYHRNRNLYEVEVTAAYPIIKKKVRFELRMTYMVRDGYVEFINKRDQTFDVISKRRVHNFAQVGKPKNEIKIQTDLPAMMMNNWTQYLYEYTPPATPALPMELEYVDHRLPTLNNYVYVGTTINFYSNDYVDLVHDEKYTREATTLKTKNAMSFSEIDLCRYKLIMSVSWHPSYTGIIATCYGDVSNHIYLKNKPRRLEGAKASDIAIPVLIWSVDESLKPKMLLETPREVTTITFCPYDENIIAGGFANGQVCIWEISGCLEEVENVEFLHPNQVAYRQKMNMMMQWSKNVKDKSKVPVTVTSDIATSHESSVTQIVWLPPYYRMMRTATIEPVPKNSPIPYSYQFVSVSLDGDVLIWDLMRNLDKEVSHKRKDRHYKHIEKRPSGLSEHVSPLKVLNRNWQPFFKLILSIGKPYPIFCISLPTVPVRYKHSESVNKTFTIEERLAITPIYDRTNEKYPLEFMIGTTTGLYVSCKWEGYDYNVGETTKDKMCTVTEVQNYHDGCISQIVRWPWHPAISLSIGGKVFCVWHASSTTRPILWRKNKVRYTGVNWNPRDNASFILTRADGILETWNLHVASHKPSRKDTLSGNVLTGYYTNRAYDKISAVSDQNGYLRLHCTQTDIAPGDLRHTRYCIVKLIEKQMAVNSNFEKWQKTWSHAHKELVEKVQQSQERRTRNTLQRENSALQRLKREKERLLKEEKRVELLKSKPQPGKYKEWAEERLREQDRERMNLVLLDLKQLRPDTLQEQQKPLKIIQTEEKLKFERQKRRHARAHKIFSEAVAMYFPHVLQEKPPPARDPYAGGDSYDRKNIAMNNYHRVTQGLQSFIKANPHTYELDFSKLIKTEREKRLAKSSSCEHRKRFQNRRRETYVSYASPVATPINRSVDESSAGGDAGSIQSPIY